MGGATHYQLNTSAPSTPNPSGNPQSYWMKGRGGWGNRGGGIQEYELKNALLSGLATKPTLT